MQGVELIETWRILLKQSNKPWVLFENGTCVGVDAPETDLVLEAQNILREWGAVGVCSTSSRLDSTPEKFKHRVADGVRSGS